MRLNLGVVLLALLCVSTTPVPELGPRELEGELTARDIYDRFLANRPRSAIGRFTLISESSNGARQSAQLLVRWKDYRIGNERPGDGEVISKTWVRFERPANLWKLTYLVIGRVNRPRDEFIYLPSGSGGALDLPISRKTRRFRVRGLGLLGTNVTVDDLIFQSIDEGEYTRLPDSEVAGIPAYVLHIELDPALETIYPEATAYIAKDTYALLRAVYRGESGRKLREYRINPESLTEYEGAWLAAETTLIDLAENARATLIIDTFSPNAVLTERDFSAFEMFHRRP